MKVLPASSNRASVASTFPARTSSRESAFSISLRTFVACSICLRISLSESRLSLFQSVLPSFSSVWSGLGQCSKFVSWPA